MVFCLETGAKLTLFLDLRNEIYYDDWVADIPNVSCGSALSMKQNPFPYVFLFF